MNKIILDDENLSLLTLCLCGEDALEKVPDNVKRLIRKAAEFDGVVPPVPKNQFDPVAKNFRRALIAFAMVDADTSEWAEAVRQVIERATGPNELGSFCIRRGIIDWDLDEPTPETILLVRRIIDFINQGL